MSEEPIVDTPAGQLASLKTEVLNIKSRAAEDREKLDKIYDVANRTAGTVDSIDRRLEGGDKRFTEHDEEIRKIKDRVGILETWKSNHGVVGKILNTLWVALVAVASAAAGAFIGGLHPPGK